MNISNTPSESDTTTKAFGFSAVATLFLNMVLTLAKESYPPLLAWMKDISILGIKHHWFVHGLILVCFFLFFGWFFSKRKSFAEVSENVLVRMMIIAFIISSLGIVLFYLFEFFR